MIEREKLNYRGYYPPPPPHTHTHNSRGGPNGQTLRNGHNSRPRTNSPKTDTIPEATLLVRQAQHDRLPTPRPLAQAPTSQQCCGWYWDGATALRCRGPQGATVRTRRSRHGSASGGLLLSQVPWACLSSRGWDGVGGSSPARRRRTLPHGAAMAAQRRGRTRRAARQSAGQWLASRAASRVRDWGR